MYFDLFLLSVVVVTGYLGPMLVRRNPPGHRAYGWLLITDLVAAVVALVARSSGSAGEAANVLGAVAIGAAVFLVVVPPMLRDLARRAVLAEHVGLARWLIDLRELLQPGMGVHHEREVLEAIMAVRAGRVEEVVCMLRASRERASDPLTEHKISERIVLTYLSARRWPEAIDTYEAALAAGMHSPQLLVEMVRAYCEVDNMSSAATLIEYLETSPMAGEPLLAFSLNRARLMFLAFAGRPAAVDHIMAPSGPLGLLPPANRNYWSGIARLRAGDRAGARTLLQKAARMTRRDRRAREISDTLLASIDQPGVAGPHELEPHVAALADRLATAAAQAPRQAPAVRELQMSGVPIGRMRVSAALVVANLLAFALVFLLFGSTGDPGGLLRAGANVKSAVKAGELWRLPSSMFLHVGAVHLLLNMYALWILGKLVEQIYGPFRMFALYMIAGLVGALASALAGEPGISAGASGAVLGLLGALIAELGLHRHAYPERWRSVLLGNLIFVAVAQVAIGFFYEAIDQSAHLGGLVSGALIALMISPMSRLGGSSVGRVLAGALVLVGAAALAYGGAGVARTSYADTLARYGYVEHRFGDLAYTAPAPWRAATGGDRGIVQLELHVLPVPGEAKNLSPELLLRGWMIKRAGHEPEASRSVPVPETSYLPMPEHWHSVEHDVWIDGMGGEQHYRVVVYGRVAGDDLWLGRLGFPAALSADIAPALEAMLASMRRL